MRDHHIAECDCSHSGLVREVLKSQIFQRRIKGRIANWFPLPHEQAGALQRLRREERAQRRLLLRGYLSRIVQSILPRSVALPSRVLKTMIAATIEKN